MRRVLPFVLLALSLDLALPGQDAETPRARYLVSLDPAVLPQRESLLGRLRAAIRGSGSPQEYAEEVEQLRSASLLSQAAFRSTVASLGGRVVHHYWPTNGAAVEIEVRCAPELAQIPGVAEVLPDGHGHAHIYVSTDANNHNADFAHTGLGRTGDGTTLALLDSGADTDCNGKSIPHPAFNWGNGQEASRLLDAFGVFDPLDVEDRHGHGTAVAGVACAVDWGSTGLPSDDGFAPGAGLCSYKITKDLALNYDESDLVAAVTQILQDRVRYGITVANLSYSGNPSPTYFIERHLDLLGYVGDVLVVTSAGNDGGKPNPTASSNSNANGLAVGAVFANSHVVTGFSTPGPLIGDAERTWPDLCAVGAGLITPWPDRPNGTGLPQTGTSFAAPAVAGTALLLRAAQPSLSVIETKALILNNVEEISTPNPGMNRYHFGLGMLRTDLAVGALSSGQLFGGQLRTAAPTVEVPVQAAQGQSYAATLAWPRIDLNNLAWDDLDLRVVDPNGKVVALSDSPRNLYERVLFDAASTGTYRLRITGTLMLHDDLDWALAFGVNQGGGRQPGTYQLFGTGCPGTGADPGQGTLLPAFAAGRFGNARSTLPLASGKARVQTAYDGASVPNGLVIDRLAFRRDDASYGNAGFQVDLAVLLGHTRHAPPDLSPWFDHNPDTERMTLVLDDRALDLPGTQGLPASPLRFDCVLPLDRPFVARTTAQRHLLLEFTVRGHPAGGGPFGLWFDAELDAARHSLIHGDGDPLAKVGLKDPLGLPISLMSGESGGVAPTLEADRTPQLGSPFRIVLRHAPASADAALVHGLRIDLWNGQPLPLALGPLGAPGCLIQTSNDFLLPVTVGASGQAFVEYQVPNLPSLTGEAFYNQFLVLDPGANNLGLTTSGAAVGRIGG